MSDTESLRMEKEDSAVRVPSPTVVPHDTALDDADVQAHEHHHDVDLEAVKFGWPVKHAINSPCKTYLMFCSVNVFFLILVISLLASGADVIPFSNEVPLYLRDDKTYERMDAVILGKDEATWSLVPPDQQKERETIQVKFELIFESMASSTVLTAGQLPYIQDLEEYVLNVPLYNDRCALTNSTSVPGLRACVRRASVINFFDEHFINPNNLSLSKYFDPVIAATPVFTEPQRSYVLGNWSIFNSTEIRAEYGVAFAPIWVVVDARFGTPLGNEVSLAVRAEYYFGVPLPGYNGDTDRPEEQEDEIGKFLFDSYDSWGESNREGGGLKLWWNDDKQLMSNIKVTEYIQASMFLTLASFVFVWFYLSVMTGSFYIGSLGMGQILFSFFPAVLIYRYVTQQAYFGTFNILSIFIILGIGADDVFVFMDHWTMSGSPHMPAAMIESAYLRMSWTYRKAGKAMLVTSLTTMFAFLANSTSSFPAIYTFGIFSALLVLVNYVSIITYWVAAVAVWNRYIEKDRICLSNRCCPAQCPPKVKDNDDETLGTIETFFQKKWGPLVVHNRFGKYAVLLFFVVFLAVFVSFAVQLEPDPETPDIHPVGSNYADFGETKAKYFGGRLADPKQFSVFLVFGITGVDRTGSIPTQADSRGSVVFDDSFNISTVADQVFLHSLCKATSFGTAPADLFILPPSANGGISSTVCFMVAFQEWYDTEPLSLTGKANANLKFPVNGTHCGSSDEDCFSKAFEKFFLDPTQRSDGLKAETNYEKYKPLIYLQYDNGFPRGIRLRFAMIQVKLSARVDMLFEEGEELFERWEAYFSAQMASAPDNLKSGFQYTLGAWHYFFLQDKLIAEAFTGIGLSLVLALIVLTFATQNIFIAVLAVLTILLIVISVIGFTVMMGWKLGILESINFILVPGLAVDYTVHLADAYLESQKKDRIGKVNDMLTEVGVSVISGAVSTLGASIFMFFAPISFFVKFAAFIFATISFSLMFSLGFFASTLAICGPVGTTGNLPHLWKLLKARIGLSSPEEIELQPTEKQQE